MPAIDPRFPRRPYDELAPCRRLACAVIHQALEDLEASNVTLQIRARVFIFRDNPGFSFWCGLACQDPKTLRRQLEKRMEKRGDCPAAGRTGKGQYDDKGGRGDRST